MNFEVSNMSAQNLNTEVSNGIAVIGIACRFPGANDHRSFWMNLCQGVESVAKIDPSEIEASIVDNARTSDPDYVHAASFLENISHFDASFFGYSPTEAELMDPQQRFFLECAWEAIEDAGYDPAGCGNTGVFAGARSSTYLFNVFSNSSARSQHNPFEVGLGNDLAFLTSRVAYKLGLYGPTYSIQTACSTALSALHVACVSLDRHECDFALAGGVAINTPQRVGYVAKRGGILSIDGHCRPFDEEANGTVFGSGVGVVLLRRLRDAIRNRDNIYAVVKGTATNNDGAVKASFGAPSVRGQAAVIERALANAGVEPDTISYVEAHGTGTRIGDPIEIRALTSAFRQKTQRTEFCAIGSVKSNIGHLDAAAGIASLLKTILALKHRQIPPTLHFTCANPQIDFTSTPFYVCSTLKPWKSDSQDGPRRAGVSAFGIGGANAHIVLEEYPEVPSRSSGIRVHLIPLSARTEVARAESAKRLVGWLDEAHDSSIDSVAFTLQAGRKSFEYRSAAVCRNYSELRSALTGEAPNLFLSSQGAAGDRSVVMMFPGQGIDCIGSGYSLYESNSGFRHSLESCRAILLTTEGWDLFQLLYPDASQKARSEALLSETQYLQPSLFSLEYAFGTLWLDLGLRPEAMVGHSLGEFVAVCLAGALPLEEALELVAYRGKLMQQTEAGAMIAVHAEERQLRTLTQEHAFEIAAVNGPRSCVLSGPEHSYQKIAELLSRMGLAHTRLKTNRAFHSYLMKPIVDNFAKELARLNWRQPNVKLVSNITGAWADLAAMSSEEYWTAHALSSVRFHDCISTIESIGGPILLEIGPGSTLQRLCQASLGTAASPRLIASMPNSSMDADESITRACAKIWIAGGPLLGTTRYDEANICRASLPTYPFAETKYWIDPDLSDTANTKGLAIQYGKVSIDRWWFAPQWKLMPGRSVRTNDERRWLILDDQFGLGRALVERLGNANHEFVILISELKESPPARSAEPLEARLREIIESVPRDGRGLYVVDCRYVGISNASPGFPHFSRALELLQVLTSLSPENAQVVFVANNLFATSNSEVIEPEKSLLIGPAIVAPQENPHLHTRCIDIGSQNVATEQMADLLFRELVEYEEDRPVALRGTRRWVREIEPIPLYDAPMQRTIKEHGVYLITGGTGAVGLMIAEFLTSSYDAHVALVGRTPLPPREDWSRLLSSKERSATADMLEAILRIESKGGSVRTFAANVAVASELQGVITAVKNEFGKINGVVHAAGVTHGNSLYRSHSELDEESSEEQFLPKVIGTQLLDELLRDERLDFFLLMSSAASVLGGLGYSAYAAANAYLDSFALSRAQMGEPWISVSWDPWPKQTKKYETASTSVDRYAMTPEEAQLAVQVAITRAFPGHCAVVTGDFTTRSSLWAPSQRETKSAPAYQRPELDCQYVAPTTDTQRTLCEIWGQVVGVRNIGIHDNFFDLGGHSLLAIQVISQVKNALSVDVPMTQFFESPTVERLSEIIEDEKTNRDSHDRNDIIAMLDQMSDEVAAAELARRDSPSSHER
jgi:Polyketide synthase modules and related proteins